MRRWVGVPYGEIERLWPSICPWIDRACKRGRGRYLPEDILKSLLNRETQLWIAEDAAAVTEIIRYPQKSYARILMGLGRRPHEIDGFLEILEQWAEANGCDGVESSMRPGFEPPFIKSGWTKTHIFMEKILE